ncbi:MAG: GrpB family protein [Solirubrobacterales bacterium]
MEARDEAIRILPYDPGWPDSFAAERELLSAALGTELTDEIHHVGSTAVPGLAAKPTVDILVGVPGLDEARRHFGALRRLEYRYAPYLPEQMHWFCKPSPQRRLFHLHLVPTGSTRYRQELEFRDRLRSDSRLAGEYEELKRSLAERIAAGREAYTDAKAGFILRALNDGAPGG